MHAETTSSAARRAPASATRARILDAATEQFYAHGIRATSADRIIERAGITKVTFYRHFRTKSDLVVAYLETQSAAEQGWIASIRVDGDAAATVQQLAAGIGSASCRPGFRGCAFINAAAEYSDPTDPVREAVDRHRSWLLNNFAEIAEQAGSDDVDSVARQLMMARDGAMVGGYLGDQSSVADALEKLFLSVLR